MNPFSIIWRWTFVVVFFIAAIWPDCATYSVTIWMRFLFLTIAIACVHSLMK